MTTTRLEAFSDGVLAIIITIMVLELKVPHEADQFGDLLKLWPVFLSYVLSFAYVGIYWNNHHHLLHTVRTISGQIMWANLHLLFWLSLIPFATGWMGENHFAPAPTALYGGVLLLSGAAYQILLRIILRSQGKSSALAAAIGRDVKGNLAIVLYVLGMGVAFVEPIISWTLYALVAIVWFVPDRRVERAIAAEHETV